MLKSSNKIVAHFVAPLKANLTTAMNAFDYDNNVTLIRGALPWELPSKMNI